MDTLPVVEVKPIYGYGWLIAGEFRREVPAAFTMKLERSEPKLLAGIVLTEGHEFEGRRVTLTQRHLEWSGYVNIVLRLSHQRAVPGNWWVFRSEKTESEFLNSLASDRRSRLHAYDCIAIIACGEVEQSAIIWPASPSATSMMT